MVVCRLLGSQVASDSIIELFSVMTIFDVFSALMNIKRQLVSGDYLKALAILKAAIVTWPEYEMFASATNEQADNMETTDASGENRYLP